MPTEVWLPIVTLLLGWIGSQVTEWQRDQRQEAKERKGREAARQLQCEERRAEFQRLTLLDLQEALLALARATANSHMADLDRYRDTGEWGYELLSDKLAEEQRSAAARASLLTARVLDDELRRLAEKMQEACTQATTVHERETSEAYMLEMVTTFSLTNRKIGEVLRTLY